MLKNKLDEYIVAQDKSKRVFSTAVFQHYLRIMRMDELEIYRQREQVRRNSEAMRTVDTQRKSQFRGKRGRDGYGSVRLILRK